MDERLEPPHYIPHLGPAACSFKPKKGTEYILTPCPHRPPKSLPSPIAVLTEDASFRGPSQVPIAYGIGVREKIDNAVLLNARVQQIYFGGLVLSCSGRKRCVIG